MSNEKLNQFKKKIKWGPFFFLNITPMRLDGFKLYLANYRILFFVLRSFKLSHFGETKTVNWLDIKQDIFQMI